MKTTARNILALACLLLPTGLVASWVTSPLIGGVLAYNGLVACKECVRNFGNILFHLPYLSLHLLKGRAHLFFHHDILIKFIATSRSFERAML